MAALCTNTTDDSACTAHMHTDVLIIGAGLAGLSTALALPASLNITILSKADLETCSSYYAQGGIAASLDQNDSAQAHIKDTLIAGAGLCAIDNTTRILGAGQQAVQWLCEQGVPFTRTAQTLNNPLPLQTDDLHLTQEGGHNHRRVAHADDATGRHIMDALIKEVKAATHITLLPFCEALGLLTVASNHTLSINNTANKRCQGAQVFDHSQQRLFSIYSRSVVLASGGLGKLFDRASAPDVCVGDGVMMAWQAGCRLANLEFIQFHPTGLAVDDSSFLISEALRGEGAYLYCPTTGKRFMVDIDARAELAPRDIVARAIAEQINNNGLGYVHLDISHKPCQFIKAHFPQIYQTLLDTGLDMTVDPVPVAPIAHYSCGGVVTCANGLTDVQGLYAAGEVAYTGLHGANRLASNSLLECVVVGRNIAAHLPLYLSAQSEQSKSNDAHALTIAIPAIDDVWTYPTLGSAQTINLPVTSVVNNHYSALTTNDIMSIITQLKTLMTQNMGIVRSAQQLQDALVQIQQWQAHNNISMSNLSVLTDSDTLTKYDLARYQLARQLQLTTLIIQSAYQRYESRGGHYRADYPLLATKARVSVVKPLEATPKQQVGHIQNAVTNIVSEALSAVG